MSISHFRTSDDRPIDSQDDLLALAERGEQVVCGCLVIDAADVLNSSSSLDGYMVDWVSRPHAHSNYLIHECHLPHGSFLFGYVDLPGSDARLPTSLIGILCGYVLSLADSTDISDGRFVFMHEDLSRSKVGECLRAVSRASTTSRFHLVASTRLEGAVIPELASRILEFAYSAPRHKFGFLEFYRVLEASFLSNVLEELKAKFFLNPKKALERAEKAVGRELGQLALMVHRIGLGPVAEQINRKIEHVGASGNDLAAELLKERRADQTAKSVGSDGAWFGCWYIYGIRCSVAHAGTGGLVYEAFRDGDSCIDEVWEELETLVWGSLGVSFV